MGARVAVLKEATAGVRQTARETPVQGHEAGRFERIRGRC